jgi:hypothetical protein
MYLIRIARVEAYEAQLGVNADFAVFPEDFEPE